MTSHPTSFEARVRTATVADITTLVHHRVEMFRDMGEITTRNESLLTEASESFFGAAVASGEYIAWLATASGAPEHIVAGAGLWLRPMLPRPHAGGVATGMEGLVANVYTEPGWRRRGLAALLMRHVLVYAREHNIDRVLLHASEKGRSLYEALGFVITNEMKLAAR